MAAPRTAPADAGIWATQSNGPGGRVLTWTPTRGDWTVVIMNDVGATVPALTGIAAGLLIGGAVLVGGGALLVVLAVRQACGERS
jgi:hypothetical protein